MSYRENVSSSLIHGRENAAYETALFVHEDGFTRRSYSADSPARLPMYRKSLGRTSRFAVRLVDLIVFELDFLILPAIPSLSAALRIFAQCIVQLPKEPIVPPS